VLPPFRQTSELDTGACPREDQSVPDPVPSAFDGPPLLGAGAAAALLAGHFQGATAEQVAVLHLDRSARLLGCTVGEPGTRHMAELPIRAIIRDALLLESRGLVLAHNHPGGDARPSAPDIAATCRLAVVARGLGIAVLDHLIFAGARWESCRNLGLI
jgi:DNA repair protein RadC